MTKSTLCLADINLQSNTGISSEGFFVLSWESDSRTNLTLFQALSADFSNSQSRQVPATGTITLTGLEDGSYFYRLDDQARGYSSNVVEVTVVHHSLARAFLFFGIGLSLFLVLLASLYFGEKGRKRQGL